MDHPEVKTFVDWIKTKAKLHLLGSDKKYIHEREIWWASFGQNVGSEMNGKNDTFERPVLVFRKISDTTFWALPITSKAKKDIYSHFIFTNKNGEENAVVWTQIRLLSNKRLIRIAGRLSRGNYKKLKQTVGKFLGIKNDDPSKEGSSRSPVSVAEDKATVPLQYTGKQ
jgi:mRNA-degrading endonuclease toxin of MazEF toxin-antitoxin module